MNKLQLIEKLEDQSFKERVYLEMINQYPDLDISLDELDEGLSNLFDKVKRAKNNAKARKLTADSKYNTKKTKALADAEARKLTSDSKYDAKKTKALADAEARKITADSKYNTKKTKALADAEARKLTSDSKYNTKKTKALADAEAKGLKAKSKAESKAIKIDSILDIKRKKNDAAINKSEKRAASKNIKFNNRLRSRAAGAEDIKDMQLDRELARKRKIEDDERQRKQRKNNDRKKQLKSIGTSTTNFVKNNKKAVGVTGGAIAATAIAATAAKKIKDKSKFKAWKEINPQKRSKVTYDQWVDLGRPLNEKINQFIEGYYDAILENLE